MAATTCSPACIIWSMQTGAPGQATRGGGAVVETRPPPLLPGRPARPLTSRPHSSLCPSARHTHTQKPAQTSGNQELGCSWEKQGLPFQSQRSSGLLGRPPHQQTRETPSLPMSTVRASPGRREISRPEAFIAQKSAQGRNSTAQAWASQDNLVTLGSRAQC